MRFKPIETFKNLPIGIRRLIISSSIFLVIILGGYKSEFETEDWVFNSLFIFLPMVTALVTALLWIFDGFTQVKISTSIPIIQEPSKPIAPDTEPKDKERFEAAFKSLLQSNIDANKQSRISEQRGRIKIPIVIEEKDILSYSNKRVRDGLIITLSETANFSFSDLKLWVSKISFQALSKNQNVTIDKKVLELFESNHTEGFASNKYEWDNAYYDEQITQLSFDETVKLTEQILIARSLEKQNVDDIDDLPF
jgi:hypothetical protein